MLLVFRKIILLQIIFYFSLHLSMQRKIPPKRPFYICLSVSVLQPEVLRFDIFINFNGVV